MAQKIGLYGGTFDPIHFGHLNLAIELLERHSLDQVWFCPAHTSPHRQEHEAALPEHRLKMVELAIDGVPAFRAIDVELGRESPSYTIDTIQELKQMGEIEELYLLLSDEVAQQLASWREPEVIVQLAPPLVGRRSTEIKGPPTTGNPRLDTALHKGYTQNPILEICATIVRARLQKGLYCGHLIPAPVLKYIKRYSLYSL